MGCDLPRWTPSAEGRITDLSPTLRSLAPVANQLTILSNLELKNAYPGTHATSNAAFLSAARAKWTESTDYYLGTTIDQVAAQQMGRETLLPSLEMSMDLLQTVGQCDNGYACVYQNNLSWSSSTSPLPMEADPRMLFERLFGDGGTSDARRAEMRKSASILDYVMDEMARLQGRLGAGDRTKVGAYLETVREVERRIQRAEQQAAESTCRWTMVRVGSPQTQGFQILLYGRLPYLKDLSSAERRVEVCFALLTTGRVGRQ
jgi:hypothetical protein